MRSSPLGTAPSLRSKLSSLEAPARHAALAPRRTRPKTPPFARNPVLQELEPRLLMSADLNPLSGDALLSAPALAGAEFRSLTDDGTPTVLTSAQVAPIQRTNELVFVDTATPDYQKLIDEIRESASGEGRHLEFVLIDAEQDGIRRITDTLAQKSGLDAIHVVSHATDGSVQLGGAKLDFETLLKRAASIKRWGQALTTAGDILFYGCDLAASEKGKSLLEAMARLTGADVAASEDPTGSAAKGGDWELEFRTGAIEAEGVVGAAAQDDWNGTLQAVAVGGETRANSTTGGTQETNLDVQARTVAIDRNGNFVVVWAGNGPGDGNGIFAQRYDAAGVAQGTEFRVNSTVGGTQRSPTVAMDANGNFLVAWTSNGQDGSGEGVYAQRYDAAGVAQGGEFLVNTFTTGAQRSPLIGMNENGTFVIAWGSTGQDGDGEGVYAQRYNAAGTAQGGEFRVNVTTAGDQWADSAAMDAAGNFIIAFSNSDGGGLGAYTRRYDAAGTALTGEVRANTTTAGDQTWTSVAMNASGAYVVAWIDSGADGSGSGIYAQRFDASGGAQGAEFRVNTVTAGNQEQPTVAIDAAGNFVITWASNGQDGSGWGAYRQDYNANGTPFGGETRVNSTTSGNQRHVGVAMNAVGQYVTVWDGNGTQPGQVDDVATLGGGVFFQRYASGLVVDTNADYTNVSPNWGDTSSISALLTTKGADGRISLREAITATNLTPNVGGPDRIYFNIAGAGVQIINVVDPDGGGPLAGLPDITDAVIIDATSQRGFAGTPLIELNGTSAWAAGTALPVASGLTLTAGSSGSTIRGFASNRFNGFGIRIDGSSNNVVVGNFLGTNAAGTVALGNNTGISVRNGATNNTIGGTTAADRNIMSGNNVDGIQIRDVGTSGNLVLGNYIGLDVTGAVDLGNASQGVAAFLGATNNTIGGTSAGAANVISGNNGEGVRLIDAGTSGHVVLGNLIGTNAAGTAGIANTRQGVWIDNAAANNTIGGTAAGAANTIAYNGLDGVALSASAGSGNRVTGNAIFSNGGLGIDLSDNGVTANDAGDADAGPNSQQNFPVLIGAYTDGASTVAIAGNLNSTANGTFRVEFFASASADASGYGEGQRYLGFTDLYTDASGNVSFVETYAASVAVGEVVTATATNLATGSTSEYSQARTTGGALVITTTNDVLDGNTSSVANLVASKGADGEISLREAIIATNNTIGLDSVFVPSGTYTLSIVGAAEELAATGDLDIRDPLILAGAGASTTTINGGGIDRVFSLINSSSAYLTGVTVSGGNVTGDAGAFYLNSGGQSLVLTHAVLSGNVAGGGGLGGAIRNVNGSLTMYDVRVTGNTASAGGGIYNNDAAFITDSLIDNNSAAANGGGIDTTGPGSALTLVNVTLSGNLAGNAGGGLRNGRSAVLQNVTITNNTANVGGGLGVGGGSPTTSIRNTIIAGNTQTGGSGPDVNGTIQSAGYNIVGNNLNSSGWVASDQQNVNPMLGSLASNGGSTLTHSLQVGSPAINAGIGTGAPLVDQRDYLRDAQVDIGAFEYNGAGQVVYAISGRVSHDVNGDSSLAGDSGQSGVSLHLFRDGGDGLANGVDDSYVTFQTTDINGDYTFNAIAEATYWVVVDSKTFSANTALWAEQTRGSAGALGPSGYLAAAGALYGGRNAALSDNASNLPSDLDTAEHVTRVAVSGANVANVDSAFSYNVVVNVDGDTSDDDEPVTPGTARHSQGTLDQFILNANNIAGANVMRFVPAVAANAGGGIWWQIGVTSLLPQIAGADTVIDGTAWSSADGTVQLDTNVGNANAATTVGTGATPLAAVARPELEVVDAGGLLYGFQVSAAATNAAIRDVAIYGFGNAGNSNSADINVVGATGVVVEDAIVGMTAAGADPVGAARSQGNAIRLDNADGAFVRDNLIGFAGYAGVELRNSSDNVQILRNEIRGVGQVNNLYDGVNAFSGSNLLVRHNLITDNRGPAIDVRALAGTGTVIEDNTITNNVLANGAEKFAVRFSESAGVNVVRHNVISGNTGTGVLATDPAPFLATPLTVEITENAIFGNLDPDGAGALLGLGIDLSTGASTDTGDGVTANDLNDGLDGPNALQNFPVLTGGSYDGATLNVAGSLNTTAGTFRIEFFASSAADASGNGEGSRYLGSTTVNQGAAGTMAINWSQAVALNPGEVITATATNTGTGRTSEFSAALYSVQGTIYEDDEGDGSISGDLGRDGVTVRAYSDNTSGGTLNQPDATDALAATTTTYGGGTYWLFAPGGTNFVTVDSKTVTPGAGYAASGFIGAGAADDVWADQTYGATGAMNGAASYLGAAGELYGGKSTGSDDATALASAEHVTRLTLAASAANVDSAFSFSAITNDRGNNADLDGVGGTDRLQQGSLRQFIMNSNAIAGVQTSDFSIDFAGGGGPETIAVSGAALPTILNPIVLDATSQEGFAGAPIVELDGSAAGGGADGFALAASNSTIRGFVINRFSASGVWSNGSNNVIAGNYVGLDLTGTLDFGNGSDGVVFVGGGSDNTVGGLAAADRNVVSGNADDGVSLDGSLRAVVIGNYIGTNAAGTAVVANNGDGVAIQFGTTNSTIGGTTAAERNVISGNGASGNPSVGVANIRIREAGTANNVVRGNYIGLDATGTVALGNPGTGVLIVGPATGTTIGGTAAGSGNVISANAGPGVHIDGSSGNVVQGNFIGTDAAGTAALGNGTFGVWIVAGSNNTIGGQLEVDPGAGNLIANNNDAGVTVAGGATGNRILGNRIQANGGLGIDLAGDGVTANDVGDGDAGANGLQNFPVLTAATVAGGNVTISGSLNSTPSRAFRIEFFANAVPTPGADPSGNGEGSRYLGFVNVVTDGGGNVNFTSAPLAGVVTGEIVSATATDLVNGETSEFAANRVADAAPVNTAPATASVNEDSAFAFSGASTISVADAQGDLVQVVLTVANGTLSAAGPGTVVGSGTASVTITGTQANINASLATVSYQGTLHYNGPDTLTIVSTDAGGRTDTDAVAITVNPVNDAPAASAPASYNATEQTLLDLAGTLSVADVDAGAGTVTVTVSVVSGQINAGAGGTGALVAGSTTSTVTITGTLAQVADVLAGNAGATIAYFNASDAPPATDTLTLTINDGGNTGAGGVQTGSASSAINIAAVNDAPTAGAPAAYAATEQVALSLASASLTVLDVDSLGAVETVTLSVVSGTLNATAGATGVTIGGVGTNTLTLTGTIAQLNNLLVGGGGSTLTYVINSNTPPATDTLTIAINDGGNTGSGGPLTAAANSTINITAVNDAPSASAPVSYNATEQVVLDLASTGLAVGDIDAGAAAVSVTVSVLSGTLSATAGATGVGIAGSGSGTLTLTGSVAQINSLLAGAGGATLNYVVSSDSPPATDTLTIAINDAGNTGFGGPLTAAANSTINITAVNDAPVNTVPVSINVTEDLASALTGISIADVDAGAGNVLVTLSVPSGTLAAITGGGVTVGGSGSGTLTLTGTVGNINAFIAASNVSFTTALNQTAAVTLTVTTDDQGNSPAPALNDVDTVTLNVTAVNDAPVNTVPVSITVTEDLASALTGISIADVDAGAGNVLVTLSVPSGTLAAITGGGVTVGGSGSGTLTLTGTVGNINAFIAASNVSFTTALNQTAAVTLTVTTDDQGNSPAPALNDVDTVTLNVTAVNDAPTAAAPAAYAATEQTLLNLAGTGLTVGDVDALGANETVTISVLSGVLNATAGATGVAVAGSGTGTLTLVGTIAQLNDLLAGNFGATLDYFNASDAPPAADTLTLAIDDGGNTGAGGALNAAAGSTIAIATVNDAPVNTVPAPQAANEDSPLVFSVAGGNAVAVTDPDAATLRVTLTATNGVLTLASLAGLAFSTGDGAADATMTFAGTAADINLALDGLSFLPSLDYNGPASIAITTEDLGQTGAGGALQDADVVGITVNPGNDAPVMGARAFAVNDGETVAIGGGNVSATDIDDAAAGLAFTVSGVTGGRFELVSAPGLAITTFTQAQILAGEVRFVHNGSNTPPTGTIAVSDGTAGVGPYALTIAFTPSVAPPPPPAGGGGSGGGTPVVVAEAPLPAVTKTETASAGERVADTYLRAPTSPPADGGDDGGPVEVAAPVAVAAPGGAQVQKVLAAEAIQPVGRAEGESVEVKPLRSEIEVEPIRAEMQVLPMRRDAPANPDDEERRTIEVIMSSVKVTGLAFSVGAVWWAARAAGLVASLLASSPAWRHVDPLPVLGRDEEEEEEVWDEASGEEKDRKDDEHRAAWVLEERG